MSVSSARPRLINHPVTSFQSKVIVKYREEERQVALSISKQCCYIPVTTPLSSDAYRFIVIEKRGGKARKRVVLVELEDLAKLLKVKRIYLTTILKAKQITRFEELMQVQTQVKRLYKRWDTPIENIWHDLSYLHVAKKVFEADQTFHPNTSRILSIKLRFFVTFYAIKGDTGKVKFISTSGSQQIGAGGNRVISTCENIVNGKLLVNAVEQPREYEIAEIRIRIRNEHNILKYLKEKGVKGIVSWSYASQDHTKQPLEILMRIYWGSLDGMINSLSKEEKGTLFMQVLETIKDMHALGIVHRDIKPNNILITRYKGLKFVLTDFEAACSLRDQKQAVKFLGTHYYGSPELFRSFLREDYLDWLKYDMWGMGIVLYYLHFGQHPLHQQEAAVEEAQKKERYREMANFMDNITIPESTDEEFQVVHEVLRNLLNPNAEQRWSASKTFYYIREQLQARSLKIGI